MRSRCTVNDTVARQCREKKLPAGRISCVFSRAELADGFRALGVAAGDTVMVHASVRAVGPIAGGPDQIHLAIKDALTEPRHDDDVCELPRRL